MEPLRSILIQSLSLNGRGYPWYPYHSLTYLGTNGMILWGFFSYQCLVIIIRFIFPFVLGDVSDAALASVWLMTICIMALEAYLARFTYKFIKAINLLSPEEHLRVQNIREMNYQHLYW